MFVKYNETDGVNGDVMINPFRTHGGEECKKEAVDVGVWIILKWILMK
jgi:hypothetical protein